MLLLASFRFSIKVKKKICFGHMKTSLCHGAIEDICSSIQFLPPCGTDGKVHFIGRYEI